MKKIILYLAFFFVVPFMLPAQWLAKQSIGNTAKRTFSSAFSLNNKVYVIGGQYNYIGLDDVWEYDIASDIWTQKNPFPGGIRGGAVTLSIGGKGYLIGGSNYVGQYFNDVWEYDDATDIWTQKNNFPGDKREEAVGFVIGNKGYYGTGYQEVVGPNSTFFVTYSDFWEYDPSADTWTQKALMPSPQRGWAVAASDGNKGYVGLGSNSNQNGSYNGFYEYDPITDIWTQKANYNASVGDAMAFNFGPYIYVCGGINFATGTGYNTLRRYDPSTDTWNAEPSMPAGATMGGVAVTTNNEIFVGTGYNSTFVEKDDWWKFTPTITTQTLCPAPVAFSTATFATNGTAQCDGKIIISNIVNGCAPYTLSITPSSGSVISTASGFTISNLCDNHYSVYVSDANCCGTTLSVCIIPGNLINSILQEELNEQINVFPNPSSGMFKISAANLQVIKTEDVKIINGFGEEIFCHITKTAQGIEFNLNKKGIYILQLSSLNGKRINKKLVVE